MHRDPIKFSVDLVEAAGRSHGHLAGLSKAALKRVLGRYKDFWRLAKAHPTTALAPAADIDEMWHLHMMFPMQYASDSTRYFGYILNHNPGFGNRPEEHAELDRIFDKTEELWKGQFGAKYRLTASEGFPRCYGFNRGILPARGEPAE